jgi:radical SAM superfamily enzyme YgiQ (UPF0313 family)
MVSEMTQKKFAGIVINELVHNADKTTYGTEPLGLEYVLAIAKQENWDVKLFDNVMFRTRQEMEDAIEEYDPDIAGFTVFDNSRNACLRLAKKIKQNDIIILFGGYHPSACPEIVLTPEVDFVITGEAEEPLKIFLQNYQNKEVLRRSENISFEEDGVVVLERVVGRYYMPASIRPVRNETYLRQKENTLNYPAPSEQTGLAHLLMKKGCKNQCIYCSSAGMYGQETVKRDMEDILDEVEELKEKDVNLIIVDDLNFTADEESVREFCSGMKRRKIKGIYFEVMSNVATTTLEMLEELYAAGVRRVGYGIESLDPNVQRFIRKGVPIRHLKSLLDRSKELGILSSGFYQIGYPVEDEQSIRRYAKKLEEQELFLPRIRTVIATPSSGSDWFNQMRKEDHTWPSDDVWERLDTQHLVYKHPTFSEATLLSLRDELQSNYYNSQFYQRNVKEFLRDHTHLRKSFIEGGWKV